MDKAFTKEDLAAVETYCAQLEATNQKARAEQIRRSINWVSHNLSTSKDAKLAS